MSERSLPASAMRSRAALTSTPSASIRRASARSSERPTLRQPATRPPCRYQTRELAALAVAAPDLLVPLAGRADVLEAGPVGEVAEEVGDDVVVGVVAEHVAGDVRCPAASPRPSARRGSGGRGRRCRRSSSRRPRRCPAPRSAASSRRRSRRRPRSRPAGPASRRVARRRRRRPRRTRCSPLLVTTALTRPSPSKASAPRRRGTRRRAIRAAPGTSARRPRRRSARARRPRSPRSCTCVPCAVSEAATSPPM